MAIDDNDWKTLESACAPVANAKCRLLFSSAQIAKRVDELAAEIDAAYGQMPLVVICVLKGGVIFFSDLVRRLHNPNIELDFVRLSSYGTGMTSSRQIVFSKDIEIDIAEKHVLIVEDIVDSGYSMRFLLDQMAERKALSVRLAALVDKCERRDFSVHIDFSGFQLSDGFIVGYGLDFAEHYRALPGIYEILSD